MSDPREELQVERLELQLCTTEDFRPLPSFLRCDTDCLDVLPDSRLLTEGDGITPLTLRRFDA
ncbi:MAG: hypothetical protein ACYDBB_22495 [Armatimonadota bacterium]